MHRLVALDLPGGSRFVDEVERVWADGDAVLPLDRRIEIEERRAVALELGASSVIDEDGRSPLPNGRPVEHGHALVIATSGSSGRAKGVVLSHAALDASADASLAHLGRDAADHWLACLPLCHIGGFSVVTRARRAGSALTVIDGFDAETVTDLARRGCNMVSLVPTTLRRIDPSLFRRVLLGGSRPPVERPSHVIATYGLTETGSGVVYDGRPLDGVELTLGTDDEILVRGPMLMSGYRDGTTSIDRDGWLHTGDIGTQRTDGSWSVEGRLDDLIKTGGEKVWPDAVEAVLAENFPTTRLVIVGVDDEEWGQKVVVVTDDPTADLDAIRGVIRDRLPSRCAPKAIVVVDSVPTTTLGKIVRRECASLAARALVTPT